MTAEVPSDENITRRASAVFNGLKQFFEIELKPIPEMQVRLTTSSTKVINVTTEGFIPQGEYEAHASLYEICDQKRGGDVTQNLVLVLNGKMRITIDDHGVKAVRPFTENDSLELSNDFEFWVDNPPLDEAGQLLSQIESVIEPR